MTSLTRTFQTAVGASARVNLSDFDDLPTARGITLTADTAGQVGDGLAFEVYVNPEGESIFPSGATASVDGFAARSELQWGGRNFVLTADSKGAAGNALQAIFESGTRRGGAPIIEASVDGYAAAATINVASGTSLNLTAVTKGAAGNDLQVLFTQQGRTNALVTDLIESNNTVRLRAGRETNVTWATLAQAISDQTGTPITATATGGQRATNFQFGTINNTRYRLSDGADAVDANTLVVRTPVASTPTVTAVLNAINNITTGKVMTASSSASGSSRISDTSGGARASVTIPIANNANLVVQFAQEGTAGNGITVVAAQLGSAYGASFSNNVLTLTIDNARETPNQIAAALNALTDDFNITASGSARGTAIFSNSIPGRIGDQTNTLAGGQDGSAGLIPGELRADLVGGEDAKPRTTVARIFGATMNQIVAAINGITTGKTMTAALVDNGEGTSTVLNKGQGFEDPSPTYPDVWRAVTLRGGQPNANVASTLAYESEPFTFFSEGDLLYTVLHEWTTVNSGNVTVTLQRLFEGAGVGGSDVWRDIGGTDHTHTLAGGASVNNRDLFARLQYFPGTYRFRAVGSAAGLRGTLTVTIDQARLTSVGRF